LTTRPHGASLTAFELLLDIDQRCRLLVADQPPQDNRLQQWSGIGFRIAGQWFVAPMGEVAEVLREPRSSRVPGVQPWVCGVANLRGRLLPVMDLSASSAWATPHRASSGGCWCWTTTTCSPAAGGRGAGPAALRPRQPAAVAAAASDPRRCTLCAGAFPA
jgi:twitching motility protein PilI